MKSNLASASVLALAALATLGSASSFAESNPFPQTGASTASSKTRAEVRAELLQAQRAGYDVKIGTTYQDVTAAPASSKSRAEVRTETGAQVSTSLIEHAYPVVQ